MRFRRTEPSELTDPAARPLVSKAWWLSLTAAKTATGAYSGTLYTTTGPPFSATPFNPALVNATAVGNATLTFSDLNNASFAYVVNGISQTKAITRQVFGPLPVCSFGTGNLAAVLAIGPDGLHREGPLGMGGVEQGPIGPVVQVQGVALLQLHLSGGRVVVRRGEGQRQQQPEGEHKRAACEHGAFLHEVVGGP